jgi:putative hydrolase of the HAD superfamily
VIPPLQAVIFDLGNTLIHFTGTWPEVMRRADTALIQYLQAAGLDVDQHSFLPEFRDRLNAYYQERESEFIEYTTRYYLKEILAEYGYLDVPEALLTEALQGYYAVSQDNWLPEEDALPTLDALKQRGYRLGLISNAADDADVQTLVDKAGIRDYFDQILTSAALGIRKPDPRVFKPLLDSWGFVPERVAMVGDTLGADILGARNAGLFSIWIKRRADTPANRAHTDTIHPDAMIGRLSDLPALLDHLNAH